MKLRNLMKIDILCADFDQQEAASVSTTIYFSIVQVDIYLPGCFRIATSLPDDQYLQHDNTLYNCLKSYGVKKKLLY